MLHLEHVVKRFGRTLAVDDVTLSIDRAEIVGLVGENGPGKTTLMRIVAGELTADSGHVHVDGKVGMVHQHFALVPEFTIAENLALAQPGFAFTTQYRLPNDSALAIAPARDYRVVTLSRQANSRQIRFDGANPSL